MLLVKNVYNIIVGSAGGQSKQGILSMCQDFTTNKMAKMSSLPTQLSQ